MVEIPRKTVDAIYTFHHDCQEDSRPHLGCSLIGSECERFLWLTFRHALRPDFSGRIVRLFKRGKLEETIFATELKAIGCELIMGDETGEQFRVEWHGGHFAGSVDGIIASGVIEAPKTPHLLEIKTINDRGYKELEKKGLKNAHLKYYSQVQVYMKGQRLKRCLFLATNKNTDDIYMERVKYDAKVANYYDDLAKKIIEAPTPPERLPDISECRWCEYRELCHGKQMPRSYCRTCAHSTPKLDGHRRWVCEAFGCDLGYSVQTAGTCPKHLYIPDLINCYDFIEATEEWVKYRNPVNGYEFINGDRNELNKKDVYTSEELAKINPEIQGNVVLAMVREELGGKVTECRPEDPGIVPF
jgi:CRISPR/Cas system-associated exonuclease Cas4 (RecB family)